MGRIKTKQVKRVTLNIFEKNPNKYSTDFNKNKQLVLDSVNVPSKKIRNIIAGYLTRLVKNKEEI